MRGRTIAILTAAMMVACTAHGGPYSRVGVNGYIDPVTWRHADPAAPTGVVNPIFSRWATGVEAYAPADQVWAGPGLWNDPNAALGPATGWNFDIVSLGELDEEEIGQGLPPGSITLVFGDPCRPADGRPIRNGAGYDFAVFENGFISAFNTSRGSLEGQIIAELAYVEVSSNGRDFARFPPVSLTPGPVGPYGTIEASSVYNLAGKHPNAGGVCTGTPFDLEELADRPAVLSGLVDINDIRYVRIVDVPGSGDFVDDATSHVAPNSDPEWANYADDHPIYDAWPTWGSGGFDLEAVGLLREQQYAADVNLDGIVDWVDLGLLASAWQSHFGRPDWNGRCDLARPTDLHVDIRDFTVFASQWGHVEQWRADFLSEDL